MSENKSNYDSKKLQHKNYKITKLFNKCLGYIKLTWYFIWYYNLKLLNSKFLWKKKINLILNVLNIQFECEVRLIYGNLYIYLDIWI